MNLIFPFAKAENGNKTYKNTPNIDSCHLTANIFFSSFGLRKNMNRIGL